MTAHPGIAIMGATATGKSGLATRLAERFGGEIVSMDSRQVYRGLDIGTAKVAPQERARVPHHLIDILDPGEINSAGKHINGVNGALKTIAGRGRFAFLVGGTGLYFRLFFEGLIDVAIPDEELGTIRDTLDGKETDELFSKLEGIDEVRARALSANDRVRIMRALEVYHTTGKTYTEHVAEQQISHWNGIKLVLTYPRPELRRRIAERTQAMFDRGWVNEVRALLKSGVPIEAPAMQSLGYSEIAAAIDRGTDPADTFDTIVTRTQQYAKRQETFFRSVEDAIWVDMSVAGAAGQIEEWLGEQLGV
jgi:tRNA dimethylallyltransferase